MPGRTYPSFGTALVAVLAGSALTSWFFARFEGAGPYLGTEAATIVACLVGALAVKVVLRSLGYDTPFLAAAGALLAQRVLGLALAGAVASVAAPPLPLLPFGVFPGLPCLVLGALIVQLAAGRPHHAAL
jgi:hypothetical protein